MIKAHLPPEKSVYSLPRAAPGSPKPSRPHIPVRRPAAIPVPAPETTPGNHPRIRPEPLRKHPRTPPPGTTPEITHTPAPAPAPTSKASLKPPPTEPALGSTHPREPALKPSLQPPAPETIPGTISETTPGNRPSDSGPPRPLRKPGHFPRSKAIRPGQGILPGTNIDRE